MPINNVDFSGVGSPLPGIINALKVASEVYGIKEAGTKAESLQQQVDEGNRKKALEAQQDSSDSDLSKFSRAETTTALQTAINKGLVDPTQGSQLLKSINGIPAVAPTDAKQLGAPLPSGSAGPSGQVPAQEGSPGTPAMSHSQIAAAMPEGGALWGLVKGQQAADAMAAKNAVFAGRLEEQKNQNSNSAGEKFEHDPIIKQSKQSLNSLDRSLSILQNTSKPVTTKDLNLAYNDYINAVAAGNVATEGKISRELPDTFEQHWNDLKAKAGQFDDLRKDPTGIQLIDMLNKNIGQVRFDLGNAIADQAKNIGENFANNSNSKVRNTVAQKQKTYESYRSKYPSDANGQGQSQSQPESGPHGNTVKQGNHTYTWNPLTKQYE